jgi:NADH-quinone oxidoreductase subunit F
MSTDTTNAELCQRWKDQPAPLLPLLHAFHDRDQFISDTSIREIAAALSIPVADLFGTVSFYHHLSREQSARAAPKVCTGPVCSLRGADQLISDLAAEGARGMPCAGRCDEPVPVLRDGGILVGTRVNALEDRPSPLPTPNPGRCEECVFARIREPGRARIEGYRGSGGYQALERAVGHMSPDQVIEEIADSGLVGRGGAVFPTGRKWRAVSEAPGEPKTIVCNADEGEPGCFKDRTVLEHDPHAVIEGMLLAAYATGATRGFLYLRYEYPAALDAMQDAVAEAEQADLLGDRILGSDLCFRLYVRRGAGAYICGEEGSLLNSLEGKHPFPRNRPPFPVTHGYEDLPTVVNNVETLVSCPQILRHGAEWYRSLGLGENAGTKVISLSGDILRPGNYEIPMGLPLRTLLEEWAGGPPTGRSVQAVTMAGLSGGFLAGGDLEVTLDEPDIRSKGSFLGAGGIMVFDDSRDMMKVAHGAMAFFAEESCGKCFPCRIGTKRLSERLADGSPRALDADSWTREVTDLGRTMMATSACGLGTAAPNITASLIKYFPRRIEEHTHQNRSPTR